MVGNHSETGSILTMIMEQFANQREDGKRGGGLVLLNLVFSEPSGTLPQVLRYSHIP